MKKNKRGRHLKYENPLNRQVGFSFRASSDMEGKLKRAAAQNKRTLSEEVFHRLLISLEGKNILQEIDAIFARYK